MSAPHETGLVEAGAALGSLLRDLGLMVITAESCTGGLVAWALTETAGSSTWFDRGFVTYSNEAKQASLGIDAALLRAHGAVSEPVARAMATGALASAATGLSIAITGIAGPGGAVPGKPVGTVCFGWALCREAGGPVLVRVHTLGLPGDRAAVRRAAALHALLEAADFLRAEFADRPPTA